MVLLDEQDHPKKFANAEEIAETFYQGRLPVYERRRQYRIADIDQQVQQLDAKVRFIRAKLAGQIKVQRRARQDIYAQLRQLAIPEAIFDKVKLAALTEEEIGKLEAKAATLRTQQQIVYQTSARELWLADLAELEKAYRQEYPQDQPSSSATVVGNPEQLLTPTPIPVSTITSNYLPTRQLRVVTGD
jgi:DNA gyrase/topoisomerase IV subunit A